MSTPCHNTRQKPSGFTLLELLLATVLTTVLMVAVMAVITRLAGPYAAGAVQPGTTSTPDLVQRRPIDADVMRPLVDILRHDLQHAGEINGAKHNELKLTGQLALAGGNKAVTHRPAEVVYKIAQLDGRDWLVREQRALDVTTNEPLRRDLVCHGLKRFQIVRKSGETLLDDPNDGQRPARSTSAARPRTRPTDAPSSNEESEQASEQAFRLLVWTDQQAEPTDDQLMLTRPTGGS